nr:PREDICTED: protein D1-like [Bemisia tabaci]
MEFSLYIFGTRGYLRRRDLTMIRIRFKFTENCLRCYFPFVISIIVCLFKIVISATNNIDHTLRYHLIIPDIIDVAPKFAINISYKRNECLRMGFKVDPAGMQHVPWVEWPVEAGTFYTLLMIDPDVPVRKNPSAAQRQHWIVGNIPRNDPHHGETITDYIGPISPKNSGLHRTTFLVYSQNSRINFREPRLSLLDRFSMKKRYKFSARKFAEKYNLTLFAVNFFRTGWPLYSYAPKSGPSSRSLNNPIRDNFAPSPEVMEV